MQIIAVTNRNLCKNNFYTQIEKIYKGGADRIILREKDLSDEDYYYMAKKCLEICGDKLYINLRAKIAEDLGVKNIHLPFPLFTNRHDFNAFKNVSVSVHSLDEAKEAEKKGADSLICGHIFKTDCKKDLPPRGVPFITQIAEAVTIPVFAIGGITPQTAPLLKSAPISGFCLMSSLMSSPNPQALITELSQC